jgi:hypothetical protein
VHPTARVPASSSLGKGTIVNVGVIIASHTHLGAHVSVFMPGMEMASRLTGRKLSPKFLLAFVTFARTC